MAKAGKRKAKAKPRRPKKGRRIAPRDAFALLARDHRAMKEWFSAFDQGRSAAKKRSIAEEALVALRVHAAIEEEIFYPALRAVLKSAELLEKAQEEHRLAKTLVEELGTGSADNYAAKFSVLAGIVRQHIKEEERALFPRARKRKLDFEALGERMFARQQELMADMRALEQAERSSQLKPYQALA
jgi:hemerythrin-like domain-containing protein